MDKIPGFHRHGNRYRAAVNLPPRLAERIAEIASADGVPVAKAMERVLDRALLPVEGS